MKLNFEQYLKVSEFLNSKNSEDFKNYRKYKSEGKLKYLLEYYDGKSINKDESQNIIELMVILKRILIGFTFSLGLLLTTPVIISKIEKKNFTKDEIKIIAEIHKSFVTDKHSDDYISELKDFISKKLKEDIKI